MMINKKAFLLSTVLCLSLNSVSAEAQTPSDTFVLSSSQMSEGGKLPITYTCDGKSISPPLSWTGAPEGTQSFALIMDHQSPDGLRWYWTLYNISADAKEIKSKIIPNG